MKLSEIPGYSRAMSRVDRLENYWRDFAFLGIDEELRIANQRIPIRLLTLRMFVQLIAVRSPFMVGGKAHPEHVVQILWRMSPKYDANDKAGRSAFIESLAPLFVPKVYKRVVRLVGRFIDRMLIDRPPTREGPAVSGKGDASFAACIVHMVAKNYGWSCDQILDTPMPVLFQFVRKLQRDLDPELETFNPLTDRFTQRVVNRYLEKKRDQN